MSLTLVQVIEKAGSQEMAYVEDAPIHYIVLNRKDNTFDSDRIDALNALLDQVEATEGPGVLVTLGSGPRHFSTGFDLPFWAAKRDNIKSSVDRFNLLMARIMTFPMPTMCVFTGTAFAGGYFLGLCHDYRVMHETRGLGISLTELKLGIALPDTFTQVLRAKLSPSVVTTASFGSSITQVEALQQRMIDATYANDEQAEKQVAAFAKRYA